MNWTEDRKQAFLWAAAAFRTPWDERTERQKEVSRLGICHAVFRLTRSDRAANWIDGLGKLLGIEKAYWWPGRGDVGWTPAYDNERSFFCCLMAQMSDKEFGEISG